jgi:hypothetical protein
MVCTSHANQHGDKIMRKTMFRLALLSAVFAMPAYAQVSPDAGTTGRTTSPGTAGPGTVAPLANTPGGEIPGAATPGGGPSAGRTAPDMQTGTTTTTPGTTTPEARTGATTTTPGAERTPPAVTMDGGTRTSATLSPGANSFTEGQARSRIEAAGFTGVTDLQKDDQGIWRGRAQRDGQQVSVGLDYQGNVATQ